MTIVECNGSKYVKDQPSYEGDRFWVCGKCGRQYAEKQYADYCCSTAQLCDRCGKSTKASYVTLCQPCCVMADYERMTERIKNAEAVLAEDYDGPVYWWGEDRYFDDIGEAIAEALDAEPGTLAATFFACTVVTLQLDATDILENALWDTHHEDAYDYVDADTLQPVLDAWCAEHGNGVRTWCPDETRYIVVDWEKVIADLQETAATATTLEGDRCLT